MLGGGNVSERATNVGERGVNGRDRGSISVMVAITAVSLVVVVGLVLDFGGQLRAMERADALAQEAARIGGQQLDIDRLRAGQGYHFDRQAAEDAARDYLRSRGVNGDITFPDRANTTTFSVACSTNYRTALLGVVNIDSLTVQGHGKATLVHGITEGTTG
ncbi:pilus assembly protein TadG-related protein [Streptomyces sp. TLI_171]|uniref:pilus assembly protein TadG-related protein n=1 Tax=Streptomyces sp. TLI_171 TaxID=1938859 RepID=UPI000C3D7042|nr:pilus assembly protein TadG-related protein [Streptomyces sp. TLI_171]RKE22588.1 putative Flp pilus-assembly TadE/G-like protein [Streptomyces sp. TLI_171]